jgi:hypothetical protein
MIHELLPPPHHAAETAPSPSLLLQRTCSCGGGADECEECKKSPMQRHGTDTAAASIPPAVERTLTGAGSPLDSQTRGFMESRFGHDFGRVRVHADAAASESARAVRADAYTVGTDIAFRSGLYAPFTTQGRTLLAHELAHVVQQTSGRALPSGIDGGPTDPLEVSADAMAEDALATSNHGADDV